MLKKITTVGTILLLGLSTQSRSWAQVTSASDSTNSIVTQNGQRFDISGGQLSQDQRNLFHSLSQFGLSQGQIVNFLTNPGTQNVLTRIIGGDPSFVDGLVRLTGSNANLFLMNPAGFVFGSNARLNIPGSLTLTTANGIGFRSGWFQAVGDNNYSALTGSPSSFAFTMSQPGAIVNAGNLSVATGQSLNVLGGTVVNTGRLDAPNGTITMTAVPGGNYIRISQPGSPLGLEIEPIVGNTAQVQDWGLRVETLPLLLTVGRAGLETNLKATPDGQVQLAGTNTKFTPQTGTTIASGSISATGLKGGSVDILGSRVEILDGTIDVSGVSGGGNIRIGGDYRGQGNVPMSQQTVVNQGSSIRADAKERGDGGRVIIWADKRTLFDGNLSAKGGSTGGQGGFAEVSGKESLNFFGKADLNAMNGLNGTLLIDPTDIEVVFPNFVIPAPNNPEVKSYIFSSAINEAKATVLLDATNNIVFKAPIDITEPGVGLSVKAGNDIRIDSSITVNRGLISLTADSDNTNGGSLRIRADVRSGGGDIIGKGVGSIDNSFGGFNDIPYQGVLVQKSIVDAGGGNVILTGVGNSNSTGATSGVTNSGIQIESSAKVVTSGVGSITLNGTGGIQGTAPGVYVENSVVESVDGDVVILGKSNGIVNDSRTNLLNLANQTNKERAGNSGVFLTNTNQGPLSTFVRSLGKGNIRIEGVGSKNSRDSYSGGIDIYGTSVSSNLGNINLSGSGGGQSGIKNNNGILIAATRAENLPNISSRNGTIALNGTRDDSSTGAGIYFDSGTIIEADNRANISLSGSSATAPGVQLGEEGGAILKSKDGNIVITGESQNSQGVLLSNGSSCINAGGRCSREGNQVTVSGQGNLTISGTGTAGIVIGGEPKGNIPGQTKIASGQSRISVNSGQMTLNGNAQSNDGLGVAVQNGALEIVGAGGLSVKSQRGIIKFEEGIFRSSKSKNIEFLGDLVFDNSDATIEAERITLGNITTLGLPITLTSNLDLTTGNLTTAGAPINLTSNTGAIVTGDLNSGGATGGAIFVNARTAINTGNIITVGTNGNAGNVTLDPINDTQVGFIDARSLNNGTAGNVDITTGRFFRANNAFDLNGILTSIATTGTLGNGSVVIRHGGGAVGIPFVVGNTRLDRTGNGTVGAIVSGNNAILPTRSFPTTFRQDNISLITTDTRSTCDINKCPVLKVQDPGKSTSRDDAKLLSLTPESAFTQEYEQYLGPTAFKPRPMSPSAIQAVLGNIEAQTGRKPAAIYLSFVPATTKTSRDADAHPDNQKIAGYTNINYTTAPSDSTSPSFQPSKRQPDAIWEFNTPGLNRSELEEFKSARQRREPKDDDRLEIIVLTSQGKVAPVLVEPPVTRKQIKAEAEIFRKGITGFSDYKQSGRQLYKWLIQPIENDYLISNKIKNLIFLADQSLRGVPFAALVQPNDTNEQAEEFLVEKYSIGLMPSFSLTDTRYVSAKNSQLLAMGTGKFEQQPELSELKFSPVEINSIAKVYPSRVLSDADFTLKRLQSERNQYGFGILHLSTHANFEKGKLSNSYIQFFGKERLQLSDIHTQGFVDPAINLLFLSACETAQGSEESELGFAGLAAKSGVQSVLATLWNVRDQSTALLATEFYNQLRKSAPIRSEALQQAQIALIKGTARFDKNNRIILSDGTPVDISSPNLAKKTTIFNHPYYWAGFTMVGNPW
jgi:filamentous hemagglutinin family protein